MVTPFDMLPAIRATFQDWLRYEQPDLGLIEWLTFTRK